jgi:phosphoribosyl-ATP pyrophosphohydrolase
MILLKAGKGTCRKNPTQPHCSWQVLTRLPRKVGEEAVELIIEAKDENDELFLNEAADLLYHLIVLLRHKDYSIRDVISVLEKRHS